VTATIQQERERCVALARRYRQAVDEAEARGERGRFHRQYADMIDAAIRVADAAIASDNPEQLAAALIELELCQPDPAWAK